MRRCKNHGEAPLVGGLVVVCRTPQRSRVSRVWRIRRPSAPRAGSALRHSGQARRGIGPRVRADGCLTVLWQPTWRCCSAVRLESRRERAVGLPKHEAVSDPGARRIGVDGIADSGLLWHGRGRHPGFGQRFLLVEGNRLFASPKPTRLLHAVLAANGLAIVRLLRSKSTLKPRLQGATKGPHDCGPVVSRRCREKAAPRLGSAS